MAFIRAKYINGEYYFYLVESRREGKLVYQDILKYLGKHGDAERYALEKKMKLPGIKEYAKEGERELAKQISLKKKSLDSLRPFPPTLENRLREELVVIWTYHSTAIEGSALSLKETATILAEGIVVGNKPITDYLAAKGHRDAVNLVFKWVDEGKKNLTEKDLLEIHRATMKNVIDSNVGAYRPVQVYLPGSSYIPPPPNQVQPLVSKLLREINLNPKKHDPIKLAATTHVDFESIHPFVDGNGRVGRLIANWILMKNGYTPIVISKAERLRYFRMMEEAQTRFTSLRIVKFFDRKVDAALDFYLKRLKPSVVPKSR